MHTYRSRNVPLHYFLSAGLCVDFGMLFSTSASFQMLSYLLVDILIAVDELTTLDADFGLAVMEMLRPFGSQICARLETLS